MALRDAHLIEAYLEMMLAERGAAANTLAAYSSDLDAFSAYLEKTNSSLMDATASPLAGLIVSKCFSFVAKGIQNVFICASAAPSLSSRTERHRLANHDVLGALKSSNVVIDESVHFELCRLVELVATVTVVNSQIKHLSPRKKNILKVHVVIVRRTAKKKFQKIQNRLQIF